MLFNWSWRERIFPFHCFSSKRYSHLSIAMKDRNTPKRQIITLRGLCFLIGTNNRLEWITGNRIFSGLLDLGLPSSNGLQFVFTFLACFVQLGGVSRHFWSSRINQAVSCLQAIPCWSADSVQVTVRGDRYLSFCVLGFTNVSNYSFNRFVITVFTRFYPSLTILVLHLFHICCLFLICFRMCLLPVCHWFDSLGDLSVV